MMDLKKISRVTLIVGSGLILVGIVLPFIMLTLQTTENGAVGIIGGADIPTVDLLLSRTLNGLPLCLVWLGSAVVISSLFCLIFTKTVQQYCGIKTSVISLSLSAVGAMGLICFSLWVAMAAFGEISKHPIAYPFSVSVGLLSLFIFLGLLVFYCMTRNQRGWTLKGFLIDVLTSILYLPSFYLCISWFIDMIR